MLQHVDHMGRHREETAHSRRFAGVLFGFRNPFRVRRWSSLRLRVLRQSKPGGMRSGIPENVVAFIRNGDPVSHANARVSIYGSEKLLTANASATVSQPVCLNQSQGRV